MNSRLFAIAAVPLLLTACGGESVQDQAEDMLKQQADAAALGSGTMPVALGMTEGELIDSDIHGPGDIELGEVIEVRRGPSGEATALLMEVEDSDPDRFVEMPIDSLTTRPDGDDMDIVSTMTREDVAALPDVDITAQVPMQDPPA